MNEIVKEPNIATEEHGLSLITSDKLSLVWKKCERYLKKSANRSSNRIRVEDIFYDCLNNNCNLWIIFNKENLEISGVLITMFNNYPTGKKMLNVEHTSGTNMQNWIEIGLETMIKFAKSNDCDGIEGIGRHGQWNWVKNRKGWKKPATFYEFNFKDAEE
jgi:hypothetical protein|tara:strand:+ start:9345 stop:9824 length:480 start_codon:yes stop_codon:yes gene_type:complete